MGKNLKQDNKYSFVFLSKFLYDWEIGFWLLSNFYLKQVISVILFIYTTFSSKSILAQKIYKKKTLMSKSQFFKKVVGCPL